MKLRSNILKLALFATGLAGIVAEYVLSTLATYFLGNSVFQFTMIVSIMLFSMGLGSRLSQAIRTNLLYAFVVIEFILSVLSSTVSLLAYTASAYTIYTGAVIYSLSVIIGLLIGMEIPIVIRLNDKFEELRVNISLVMEKDYYGSLLGGVFFAFVGLPFLGLTYTPFMLGSVNFLVAIGLYFVLRPSLSARNIRLLGIYGVGVALIIGGGAAFAGPIIDFGEQARYQDKVIYAKQSAYQRIVITEAKGNHWLYINGNLQLSTVDEVLYHEPLVHPALSLLPQVKQVLILGGGDGCAVREVLKYPSVEKIVLVDLDPAMTQLAASHPVLATLNQGALEHPMVSIINQDAYTWIEAQTDYYDAIIIDLPDPKTIELGRLYSYEFYTMCYNRLRKHGVMVTQAGSPYYAPLAFNCIDTTMAAAGFVTQGLHNQVLTLGEWGWVLGVKGWQNKAQLKPALQQLAFDGLQLRWLNNEAMGILTNTGKPLLPGMEKRPQINSIHNPVLERYYRNANWELY